MRTSEEIYHRVRWDARFDPARFVLGVRQRGAVAKRVPLASFVPGGEIPWHRVEFVEADGEPVWDRASGLDRLDDCAAGRVRRARLLRAPHFTARTPHRWDAVAGGWTPVTGEGAERPPGDGRLRVLTWNTLWDRYDADRIDSARRRPMLLAALEHADADVVALQEVDAALLRAVLNSPWVRARYLLAGDPGGRAVADTGLLLLSRLPLREAGDRPLGPHKALLAATVETAAGPVVVAVTHLSSDHSPAGADRRRSELGLVAEGLAGIDGEVVLAGDFNDGGATPSRALGLSDVWSTVRGARDRTPTFDPSVNPLAAVSSLTGRAARLDRVLLRPGGALRPRGVRLIGELPDAEGWFASDHFGVVAELTVGARPEAMSGLSVGVAPGAPGRLNAAGGSEALGEPEVLDVPPTARTAVAWIPARGLWPAVQEVRRRHDPQVDRWPPHVNVLFGFVPEADFNAALGPLAAAVAEVPPFEAVLAGVRSFDHRDDATVWLDPAAGGAAPWQALRRALERRFPRCRGRAEGWTPHLTLGRTREPARLAAECAPRIGELTSYVGELAVLSRRGDEPFAIRATVALGTGEVRWAGAHPQAGARPQTGAHPQAGVHPRGEAEGGAGGSGTAAGGAGIGDGNGILACATGSDDTRITDRATGSDRVVAGLVARLEDVAARGGGVARVVGSRRTGCARAGADLDLVVALPGAVDTGAVRRQVAAVLPPGTAVREVTGARVPGLRWRAEGVAVDLVLVGTGEVAPAGAVARRTELGDAAAVALSAVSDADAVVAAVAGRHAAFARLARTVKVWAASRGLDSAPFGGLPGLAWSVLAARTVLDAAAAGECEGAGTHGVTDDAAEALLRRFFGTWAAWDWREPVALSPADFAESRSVAPESGSPGVRSACVTQESDRPGDALTVLTPTAPVRSCTAQVGAGTRELLTAELYRTWELLAAGGGLGGPAAPHRRHAAWAVLTVDAVGGEEFGVTVGRFRGRVRALAAALEDGGVPDAHAWPRPFSSTPDRLRYAVGLGRTPPDAGRLAALSARWARGLPGVTVTRAAGGDVPTLG
ncbi:RNA repair domain-containing protein [Streptomyces sp. SL13]|uniref:RNA repair domain-containing protein n=1 Tax=Streptantibioticus silvisoli TaxID=2705255 RepID=A0AA90JVW7_9ACTN|nr:RNA repair domain-containing protein [Streptantibioticus silvisoli]MDI5968231.1 RNA repair domain-containing protein [Streptantibioticus silvisoli]